MRTSRLALIALLALAPLLFGVQSRGNGPPPKPVWRYSPKLYDMRFQVTLSAFPSSAEQAAVTLVDTPFILPLILRGPTSKIDPKSLQPELWFDSTKDPNLSSRARIEENKFLGLAWAIIPVGSFQGSTLRWSVSWRAQVWSVVVDDAALARATWPRDWPAEVQDALKLQTAIESDSPVVAGLVQRTAGDKLRTVPPYFAAKDLIRAAILEFRSVDTEGLERRAAGTVVGLTMVGAANALANGRGSSHDLVAACVATLRAAGIPARPVVGITKVERGNRVNSGTRTQLVSWGEFFVPDCGWVQFDPLRLRGGPLRTLDVTKPWRGLGTMDDLNEAVPVSWTFTPEGASYPNYLAVWGWMPTGQLNALSGEASVSVQMISRGRGTDDVQ